MRTSKTHPLEIANIVAPTAGGIGVTFLSGQHQMVARQGAGLAT